MPVTVVVKLFAWVQEFLPPLPLLGRHHRLLTLDVLGHALGKTVPMLSTFNFECKFIPLYVMSLYALANNHAWVWFAGQSWGWAGPLVLVMGCGTPSKAVYGPLLYFDFYATFPLSLVGQLQIALAGDPRNS